MCKVVAFCVLALGLMLSGPVYGQVPYTVNDEQEQHIFVYDFIAYLKDSTHRLSLEDVQSEPYASQFVLSRAFAPSNYDLSATYWLKVSIDHRPQSKNEWLLEFFDQTIDSITAYIPRARGGYDTLELGDRQNFGERTVRHKNFVIPINNDHDQTLTYYFRVKASHPVDFLLVLRTYRYFTYYSLVEYFLFGVFYGLLLLIALYNLLLYVAIQEKAYLIFVLYAISVAFYFSSSDGFAYQFVWPRLPQWNQVAYGVFTYLTVLFAVLFTQSFLHLRAKAFRLYRLLTIYLVFRTLYFGVCLLARPVWFDFLWVDALPLLGLLFIAFQFLRQGYQPARLFTLAYIFLFLGVLIKALLASGLGILASNAFNYYSFHLAFLLQLITFSFALGDKVRIIRKNRDVALKRMVKQLEINAALQTKVNRELEQKVAERTVDLKHANEKLETQAAEIKKINQLLDQNNWQLKKASASNMRRRLLSKGVSYAEFRKLFPQSTDCLQYLADLKWGRGFACRKCAYNGSTDNQQFGKRCSRCGYVESVTSHTLFHNLRFPLEKAFYIAHVEISGLKITSKALAHTLDLRPATCSGFRGKVRSAIARQGTSDAFEEGMILLHPEK